MRVVGGGRTTARRRVVAGASRRTGVVVAAVKPRVVVRQPVVTVVQRPPAVVREEVSRDTAGRLVAVSSYDRDDWMVRRREVTAHRPDLTAKTIVECTIVEERRPDGSSRLDIRRPGMSFPSTTIITRAAGEPE